MPAISAAILLVISGQVATEEALRPLLDFAGPEAAQKWQAVNDGVMGGASDGRFKITEEGTLDFFGTLSLENNGGFASVRTKPTDLDIETGDTLVVRVKGDGREYVLNLYTSRQMVPASSRSSRKSGSMTGVSVTSVGGSSRGFMRLCGPHNTMACPRRRHPGVGPCGLFDPDQPHPRTVLCFEPCLPWIYNGPPGH